MGTQHHYITNNIPQKLHSVFWCKIKFYHYHSIVIAGNGDMVPHFVFLAHIVDVSSSMHAQFVYRSFASLPYTTRFFLLPGLPITFLVLLAMWAWSKTFLVSFYYLRGRLHQTWVVPRCGFQVCPSVKFVSIFCFIFLFPPWMPERMEINKYWLTFLLFSTFLQYFLPFATEGINNQIEQAILRADKIGVKVISLAALNKVWHIALFLLLFNLTSIVKQTS